MVRKKQQQQQQHGRGGNEAGWCPEWEWSEGRWSTVVAPEGSKPTYEMLLFKNTKDD